MSAHTPGPWEVDYHSTIGHIKALLNPGDFKTPTVARFDAELVAHSLSEEERYANAHLIAAAPELLGMVKSLLACLEQPGANGVDGGTTRAVARQLIAKAEGKP